MRFFFRLNSLVLLSLPLLLSGCASQPTEESISAHIRFYSINDFDQLAELSLVPGREEPGCHDMPLDLNVHRVAQIGFSRCQLFTDDTCSANAAIQMRWTGKRSRTDENKNQPTVTITEGALWQIHGQRETEVGSWRCDVED
ncbi:MAG: hypothetical protein ACO3RT_03340 [Arenicellales bacterium]|nr:hypothetical protein [Gammaproteobacteria bacterium]NDA13901.1 hypothetical protein [Gammaproteobacteria bacterium]